MITNTLNRRLLKVQQEKVDMEVALEQEQEFIINRLQKQLDSYKTQAASPGNGRMMSSPTQSVPEMPDQVSDLLRAEVFVLEMLT